MDMEKEKISKEIKANLTKLNKEQLRLLIITLKLSDKYKNSIDVIKHLKMFKCPRKLKNSKKKMIKILRTMQYEQTALN